MTEKKRFSDFTKWSAPYGLIYGQFEDERQPGNKLFGQFMEMIEVAAPSKARPRGEYETVVSYAGTDIYLTLSVNPFGTYDVGDYIPCPGDEVITSLNQLRDEGVKPFWIEIYEKTMSILFTNGKTNYRTQVYLEKGS